MRRTAKKPTAPKALTYVLIPKDSDVGRPMYERLYRIVDDHHEDLSRTNVRIALAWATSWKADVDGRLTLGKCKKASELDRELAPFDFVILLNRNFWENLRVSDLQRTALLDHELCHCGIAHDEKGEPKIDERGRTIYRMVKHSIEEFVDIIDRHGMYKVDLEAFARAIRRSEAQTAATWTGYAALVERLALAGLDIAIEHVTEWSEVERKQADTWARLEIELQHTEAAIAAEPPSHVTAAAANLLDVPVQDESWKTIEDYPDYEVSDCGRVRRIISRTSGRKGQILRMPLRSGYPCVDLSRDGAKRTHNVHRLVAAAFLDPVDGAHEVNHIDGVKTHNAVENLEWSTRQDNQLHAFAHGLQDAAGERNGFAKLTESDVARIRELAAASDRPSYQAIADQFQVTESNIRAIVTGRSWNTQAPPTSGAAH